MKPKTVRVIALAISFLAGLTATTFGVVAVRANEVRWHQGPTVLVLSPTHGLHKLDVLLLGAAMISAMVALIASIIARR